VLHTVDDRHVVVLVVEVLPRFGEAAHWVPQLHERNVVAGAQVPVAPPGRPHVHAGGLGGSHIVDEPAKPARHPVVLPADRRTENRDRSTAVPHYP